MPKPAGIQAAEQTDRSIGAGFDCKKCLIPHVGSLRRHLHPEGGGYLSPEGGRGVVGAGAPLAAVPGQRGQEGRDAPSRPGLRNELGSTCYHGDMRFLSLPIKW